MRIISRRVHGVIDYLVGAFLIFAPGFLGFAETAQTAATLLTAFGAIAILYSLLTRYELGVLKLIPFGMHLKIDFVWGLLLAASPWLFGFADQDVRVWVLHVGAGIAGMLVPVISVPLRRPLVEEAPQNS